MSASTRSLRPRSSRPSYAQYAEDDVAADEEGSSSDEFEPEKDAGPNDEDEELVDGSDEDAEGEIDEDALDLPVASTSTGKTAVITKKASGAKTKAKPAPLLSAAATALINTGVARKTYAKPGPLPNNDHRHRCQPLFQTDDLVLRQVSPPNDDDTVLGPFADWETKPTRNWTSDPAITNRLSKASGNNIGRGPIWELMEDRSWWKEAHLSAIEEEERWNEAFRRPRVHSPVSPGRRWSYLDQGSASKYVPNDGSPMTCLVGPLANQRQLELNAFDVANLYHTSAHIFNAGSPVSSLDWCPIFSEDRPNRRYKQYLAVAPLPSKDHNPLIGVKSARPSEACMQIWSLEVDGTNDSNDSPTLSSGRMNCELILCVDSGPAQALRWCPLPSNDPWHKQEGSRPCRKLGILGGTFEDGSLSIFIVPDPDDVRKGDKSSKDESRSFVKVEPAIRIELEETSCWSLDWANSSRLAVGCTNGFIAVYDIDVKHLCPMDETSITTDLLPSYYISMNQSAIRAISWIPVPPVSASGGIEGTQNPIILSTGGYDGCLSFVDLREGGCAEGNVVNRTRDVMNSITYSHYTGGVFANDGENWVKTFSINPTMLGRGHSVLESGSPIWSLGVSDYHSHLAIGCADGSCSTTNTLRSTRRSTSNPFVSYKIFHLDYNRKTGVYRLLDQFLPTEIIERQTSSNPKLKAKKDGNVPDTRHVNSGAWPTNVSVTCVRWNSAGGLSRAPLLASATASGLCRVDWLLGHFARGHVPYGGIECIRKESGADASGVSDEELEEEESD